MADDVALQVFLAFTITLMLVGVLYAGTRRRRKPTAQGVVIIREGRLPGEPRGGITCQYCGRRFKHTITFKDEVVKCPFCGNEVV